MSKELADFNPATAHLHECAANENSKRPCDAECISYLYDVAVDLGYRARAIPEAPPAPVDLNEFMEKHPPLPAHGPAPDAQGTDRDV